MVTFLKTCMIVFLVFDVLAALLVMALIWEAINFERTPVGKLAIEKMNKEEEKTRHRRHKEETATGGFFEELFEAGFDATGRLIYRDVHRLPRYEGRHHLVKQMDRKADDEIFKSTEVI